MNRCACGKSVITDMPLVDEARCSRCRVGFRLALAFKPHVIVGLGLLGGDELSLAVRTADYGGGPRVDDWRVLRHGAVIECRGPLFDVIDATIQRDGLDAFGIADVLRAHGELDDERRAEQAAMARAEGWS